MSYYDTDIFSSGFQSYIQQIFLYRVVNTEGRRILYYERNEEVEQGVH